MIRTTTSRPVSRLGFTIIELMIAMAATLLIMGALTRAFGLVGNSIRDSRLKVLLSGQTRDLMFGLRTELGATTASNDPSDPDAGVGYLVIHEGPMADATTTTFFGTGTATAGYFPLSRWGDTDDYIAYTVKAPADSPFLGIVPWGVLEAAKANELGPAYGLPSGYNPAAPRVIQSQFAEVCYWMGPRMVRTAAGGLSYESDDGDDTDGMSEAGMPQYVDVDGDDYPDEFVLYRRTLLIRPDLNVTFSELTAGGISTSGFAAPLQSDQPVVGYLISGATGPEALPAHAVTGYSPGAWAAAPDTVTPNWLIGMAAVQNQMDLSVAREFILDQGNGLSTGVPAEFYSANTLEQLRSPHRRFAHVMIPPGTGLMSGDRASMPLLALAPPLKFLAKGPTPPVTTSSLPVTDDSNTGTPNMSDRFTMVGHLRPEFALGGLREGDDIVGTNIAGFDVKVFDPGAPVWVVPGPDGAAGRDSFDDNDNGTVDEPNELGSVNSDDQVVTPNDPFSYVISRSPSSGAPELVSLGTFVDIGYAQQSGGNIRFDLTDGTLGNVDTVFYNALSSSYSGIERYPPPAPPAALPAPRMRLAEGFRFSGKFVRRLNGFSYVQPTFDSWTNEYQSDNINQATFAIANFRLNGTDAFNAHYWIFNGNPGTAGSASAPAPSVNADSGGTQDFTDPKTSQAGVFQSGFAPSDVQPPIRVPLKAVKISVRNYDIGTRQFGQLEVVHHFE